MKSFAVVLVVVVAILGGFYAGYKFAQAKPVAAAGTGADRTTTGAGGTAIGRGGACPTPGATPSGGRGGTLSGVAAGTVTSLTASSMTVHNAQCNTDVKVTFASNVAVRKTVTGSTADLQQNQTVTVAGRPQADGSILASSITIGAVGGQPGGRPGTPPPGG
ncbi:MAG TPA: DUF5666 domain-containing protein [Candidatus Acidoferrales bacterium]|nr:DUF5666 domain-containing protein [Candidatus Acidoferrales bacterium]